MASHLPQKELCAPHISGVAPGMPPFFTPWCKVCEAKRLAGKVTGDEPLPVASFRKRNSHDIGGLIRRARAEKAAR
ncbi:MAG TPA: hypothetical protein VMS92_23000 [Mycobacterium sp.]|nr:hypothetical protein [Mycobacterium sp.]